MSFWNTHVFKWKMKKKFGSIRGSGDFCSSSSSRSLNCRVNVNSWWVRVDGSRGDLIPWCWLKAGPLRSSRVALTCPAGTLWWKHDGFVRTDHTAGTGCPCFRSLSGSWLTVIAPLHTPALAWLRQKPPWRGHLFWDLQTVSQIKPSLFLSVSF